MHSSAGSVPPPFNGSHFGALGASATPRFQVFVDQVRKPSGIAALGARDQAVPLRLDIEDRLSQGLTVVLDFEGVEATQSFMDELVGILVLERGPDVLSQLRFRRCSADMKGIIQFVVSDRAQQYKQNPHLFAPR